MRGMYTAGVLDVFIQNNIKIDVLLIKRKISGKSATQITSYIVNASAYTYFILKD